MDLINNLAELALATRLKRLSERLSGDVNKIYKESDVDFESKWYLVLELLNREKTMAITDIANSLKLSHPAIVQFANQLIKKKLLKASSDKKDGRKRMVSLTINGKRILEKISPILESIKEENKKWVDSGSANLLQILNELELALDEQSMYQRVKTNILQKKSST